MSVSQLEGACFSFEFQSTSAVAYRLVYLMISLHVGSELLILTITSNVNSVP